MEALTIEAAVKIAPNTDEFEAAMDHITARVEAGEKAAEKILLLMLQRNSDFVISAIY